MKLIAAIDNHWNIGKDGALLVHIPQDMKFFREKTMGKVVVMGRKTLESFPGKKPLKGRTNIVLTTSRSYKVENAIVVNSLQELNE
ncbi:MAG: dihydrofolate reductase, partial [Oscillospiraceae bacterium]|nr:dihydrofolate reductase [Oscillospiraceae bacterium]